MLVLLLKNAVPYLIDGAKRQNLVLPLKYVAMPLLLNTILLVTIAVLQTSSSTMVNAVIQEIKKTAAKMKKTNSTNGIQ